MSVIEIADFILRSGCGTNIDDLKSSKAFKKLQNQQETLFSRHAPETDTGIMLRAGHLLGGQLLNSLPEKEALKISSHSSLSFGHGFTDRALLRALGEEMIQAATANLPPEVLLMAQKWNKATTEEQLSITKDLYFLFTTESQREKKDMSYKVAFEMLGYDMRKNQAGPDSVLPLKYGLWNRQSNNANCQGKTQMLYAFAQLAGAECILLMPNILAKDVLEVAGTRVRRMLSQDIEDRGIIIDPSFEESFTAHMFMDGLTWRDRSFHICPALRLRDGSWVIIDSNAMSWGKIGLEWRMDESVRLLKKYEEVLPGITLGTSNPCYVENSQQRFIDEAKVLLQKSRKLQEVMDPLSNVLEVANAFIETGEFDFVVSALKGKEFVDLLDNETRKGLVATMLFSDIASSLNDPELYLKQKKGIIYSVYHMMASDNVNDTWVDEGHIIHPEFHVSVSAPYQIALSAFNTVQIDMNVDLGDFFLNYGFCQTNLYNAMVNKQGNDHLAAAAAKAAGLLPLKHPLCLNILKKNYGY